LRLIGFLGGSGRGNWLSGCPFFLFVSGDSFSPQAFPSFILFYFIGWVVGQGILWL